MAGDPENVRLWADADVYVTFDVDADEPADADTPFDGDWDLVGLLDGDAGFTTSRSEDSTTHFAWGGIPVRTTHRNFLLTRSFTAIETNETTRRLAWPGSSPGAIKVPRREWVKVAFETRDGDVTHRLITHYRAQVSVDGDVTENESDLAGTSFVVTIFPDPADLTLLTEQTSDDGS